MFVSKLEGLDQAQGFVHGASHRQVIDGDLPQDAFVVNHKQTPERNKLGLQRCTYGLHSQRLPLAHA